MLSKKALFSKKNIPMFGKKLRIYVQQKTT